MSSDNYHARYRLVRSELSRTPLYLRLALFVPIGLTAVVLWLALPGVIGLVTGGLFAAFFAMLVVGEAWRQAQIHVLGLSPEPQEADSEC